MNLRFPAALDQELLAELAPLLRRTLGLDTQTVVRLCVDETTVAAFVRLPFDILVSRRISTRRASDTVDVTVTIAELLHWLDDPAAREPMVRDGTWRGGIPPRHGWHQVEVVPDEVVRGLVRTGALAAKEAAPRAGRSHGQSEVAEQLLDSVVLTATDAGGAGAQVTLRMLSALTRMGFLPRGSHVSIDICGRWTRVGARFGAVFSDDAAGLTLLR